MDSGKAEGREAGPVADEESSVESGRDVPAGGSGIMSGEPPANQSQKFCRRARFYGGDKRNRRA